MAIFKAKPNYKVSAMGKLVRFGSNWTVTVNKPEVIKFLDGLPQISRIDLPAKPKANAKAPKKEVKSWKGKGEAKAKKKEKEVE